MFDVRLYAAMLDNVTVHGFLNGNVVCRSPVVGYDGDYDVFANEKDLGFVDDAYYDP